MKKLAYFFIFIFSFTNGSYAKVCEVHLEDINHKFENLNTHKERLQYLRLYVKNLLKTKIYGKFTDEILIDYLYEAGKRGVIEESYLVELLEKTSSLSSKESSHIYELFSQMKSHLNEKINLNRELRESYKKLLSEALSPSFEHKEYLLEQIFKFGNLKIHEVAIISQGLKEVESLLTSSSAVDKFINTLLICDSFKSFEKISLIQDLKSIYLAAISEIEVVFPSKLKNNFLKRYKKIESKKKKFEKKRFGLHSNSARSHNEARSYEKNLMRCKARNFSNLSTQGKKKTMRTLLGTSLLSVTYGFYITGGFEKDRGVEKYVMEMLLGLLSVGISTPIFTSSNFTNAEKFILSLIYSLVYNNIDSKMYQSIFGVQVAESPNLLPIEAEEVKRMVSHLSKFKDVEIFFNKLNSYEDYKKNVPQILASFNYRTDQTVELSESSLEHFLEVMSIKNEYLKKHRKEKRLTVLGHANLFLTGAEEKDRLRYNNAYSAVSSLKATLLGVFVYNLYCRGAQLGPVVLGGALQPAQAGIISAVILFFDKWLSTHAYYYGRNELIGQ